MTPPTRGEAYSKLLHHLQEAQNQAAMLAHLHNTEISPMDKLLARGWLGISEMLRAAQHKITEMAMGRLQ